MQYSGKIDPGDFSGFDFSAGKNEASANETDDDGEDRNERAQTARALGKKHNDGAGQEGRE